MTRGAGRRQGGDFLPLNCAAEKDAILSTGLPVAGLNAICVVCMRHEGLPQFFIEMYTSIMYKLPMDDKAQPNYYEMYIALCLGLTVTCKSVL